MDMIAPLKKSFASSTSFPTKKIKNASINWGDINADRIPELKLQSYDKKIYIDLAKSAEIIGWKQAGDSSSDLLNHKNRGFLDQINILGKESARFHFNVRKIYFKNNAPCVELEYSIPQRMDAGAESDKLEGLSMRKIIVLRNNGNDIYIKWELKNTSPRKTSMPFYLRFKNHPRLGARAAGNLSLGSIGNITLITESGTRKINSSSPQNNLFLNKENSSHTFLNGKAVAKDWFNKLITVRALDGKTEVDGITFETSKSFAGVYIWWGNTYTIELLSPQYNLKYGEIKKLSYTIKRK